MIVHNLYLTINMLEKHLFALFLITVLWDVMAKDERVKQRMEAAGIVPQIIPEAPLSALQAIYASDVRVDLGNVIGLPQVQNPPQVAWCYDAGAYYTLMMFDPDAPNRTDPFMSIFKHWLVGNIIGNDLAVGDVIAEYLTPTPPLGSGFHRYILLVFKQPNRLIFDEPKSPKHSNMHRLRWELHEFIKKYHLGRPVAGNFYRTEHSNNN